MLISQMLRFPIRIAISDKQKKTVNRTISIVIIIVLFPSVYFGYVLVQKERFISNATDYIRNVSFVEGNYLLKHDIEPDKRIIKLIYGGNGLTDEQQKEIQQRAEGFSVNKANIEIQQGLSFDEISSKNSEIENMRIEISHLNMMLHDKDLFIDSLNSRPSVGKDLLKELKELFPDISQCTYADSYTFNDTTKDAKAQMLIILKSKDKEMDPDEKEKITNWTRTRLKSKNVKVIFE
jgi:hypothetical protein